MAWAIAIQLKAAGHQKLAKDETIRECKFLESNHGQLECHMSGGNFGSQYRSIYSSYNAVVNVRLFKERI